MFLKKDSLDSSIDSVPSAQVSSTSPTVSDEIGDVKSNAGRGTETNRSTWAVFQDYLQFAKTHDKVGLASLSYKVSDTCADPKQEKECFVKMDAVYVAGSVLKEQNFINISEDSKQTILSTGYTRQDSEKEFGISKSVIMFIKDGSGKPRLVALKPNEKWTIARTATSTVAQLEAKLARMIVDADKDGMTDDLENCVFPDNFIVFSCEKTDPLKKDSNGNGYWDSFETYLK